MTQKSLEKKNKKENNHTDDIFRLYCMKIVYGDFSLASLDCTLTNVNSFVRFLFLLSLKQLVKNKLFQQEKINRKVQYATYEQFTIGLS